MQSSALPESELLADWAARECAHLDLISSWEDLNSAYLYLGFTGPDSDEQRLDEYKYIITEMNKFLTRMRSGLASAHDIESALFFLVGHMETRDASAITGRQQIAYNKLKQQWIKRNGMALAAKQEELRINEGERDD